MVLLVLKHFLMCRCQPGTLELLARKLGPTYSEALLDPHPGHYYPTAQIDDIAHALSLYLTDGQPESFAELVYEIALFGLRHGFRHAIELGDTRQVLDSVPELWGRLEPGHPGVQVTHEAQNSLLSLAPDPKSSDELRQGAIVAVVSALLFAATGRVPVVSACRDDQGGLRISVDQLYC